MNKKLIKTIIYLGIAYIIIDIIYRILKNISPANKEDCILYQTIDHKIGFLFFEYFFELTVIVLVGIFLAVIASRYFKKYKALYPKNPFSAFLLGSILPICACTTIPLIKYFKTKIKLNVIITFIVAAPLLNPYIIFLSFSLLGTKYAILRIISSFVLSISVGYIVAFFYNRYKEKKRTKPKLFCNLSCMKENQDIYNETYSVFKKALPFILLAGLLGIIFELFNPKAYLLNTIFENNIIQLFILGIIGVPLYFCNGAEIIFLKPFIHNQLITVGSAITFSLTSTAICITSIIMLTGFLGKRLTIIFTISIFILSILIGFIINLII